MTTSRFHLTRELFLEACKLPPEDVPRFLDEACAGDSSLRVELGELLQYHNAEENETSFLPWTHSSRRVPESIAGYRILRKIGEGGMGEVFEAEQQEPVRRKVALKVLRMGLATNEVLARFEQEQQALALMDHPNIATVFGAGSTEEGYPFFVMEYVEGPPITDYCDNLDLGLEDRLALFIQVCHGVQHAHQKAIIHRDLKPSNVLVALHEDRSIPKIIDFGVAKATSRRLTDRTLLTELGQCLGTPEYMSPEQTDSAGKNVDTRTDVYSLGVVLYELLTGVLPFDSEMLREVGFEQMRHHIRTKEPTRPSTRIRNLGQGAEEFAKRRATHVSELIKKLHPDLDAITMKALSKDQARRFSSPRELAADIERHLRHEPVQASPASAWYLLERFVRRHKAGVAAASALLLTLLLAVAGTSIGLVQAKEETRKARAVSTFLLSMFERLDPYGTEVRATSLLEILDLGADRIQTDLEDQPVVRSRLMGQIALAYRGFFEYERAIELLEQSAAIQLEHLGSGHPDYAETLFHLGTILADVGDYEAARSALDQVVVIQAQMSPQDSAKLAMSQRRLGSVRWRAGDKEAARSLLSSARMLLEGDGGVETADLGKVIYTQGIFELSDGNQEVARALLAQSIRIFERTLGPDHFEVGWTLLDLAFSLGLDGRHAEARAAAIRGLEMFEKTFGPNHPTLALGLNKTGQVDYLAGNFDAARSRWERSLAIMESNFGPDDWRVGGELYSLAAIAALQGRSADAIDLLRRFVNCGASLPLILQDEDLLSILEEEDFESLRGEPGFEAIVAEIRALGKPQ